MPGISIVSPIYNESGLIPAFLDAVEAALAETGETYEIVLVDDGSPDDSWEYLSKAARERTGVTAIRLARNFGKEAALTAGLDKATGDAVITLDSDLQHPPPYSPNGHTMAAGGSENCGSAQRTPAERVAPGSAAGGHVLQAVRLHHLARP